MNKLENKIALVTGAAGGLGKQIAKTLLEHKATVIISDINEELLHDAYRELESIHDVDYVKADVSNKQQVVDMIAYIVSKYGKIDILVNNAGGSLNTPKHLEDIEEEDWDLVIDVNLKGTFLVSQAAVKYMKENNYGKIINISSIGGRTASLVTGVPYAAAKGGVISLSRRLAKEVGKYNINVNVVAPGLIISGERMHRMFYEKTTKDEQERILASIPLNRLGDMEDIANAVLFLASDDSKYMTGAVLDVNGGRFMG